MTGLFVVLWLAAALVVQAWLTGRQYRFLVRHRGDVPPVFKPAVTAAQQARAADYGRARLWPQFSGDVWSVALALGWTLGGGLAALVAWLPAGWVGGVVLLAVFAAADQMLRLPPQLLRVFGVEARFGFNRAGIGLVLRDTLVRATVAGVLGALAGALLLTPVAALGAAGWGLAAVLAVAAGAGLLWAQPRVIAPLFNSFRPLEPGNLRTRLEAMIERCGARAQSMFVMDGSRRSGLANAYFSGFGRAKKVVLFDTLIAHLDDEEIEAVLAHELGHDRQGHLRRHYAIIGALVLLGVAAWGLAGSLGQLAALGVPAAPAAWLAAGYLLLPLLAWPLQTWLAARLRRYEFEADAYAAAHADVSALISALKKLLARNAAALMADPLYAAFYASHPPPDRRLAVLDDMARVRSG